ncbi:N-formylglutamate deformylase [Bordetella genomosp. 6]|nr:N-formylglutamate deformylase [Bordetella genomosp. 6]
MTRRQTDMAQPWLTIHEGGSPLVCSIPHAGSWIPDELRDDFVSGWDAVRDCDWWVDRLYDFARDLDATLVCTKVSRSVIDVNRPADGRSLYPGQATTGLCPTTNFDGAPLYRAGREPDDAAIARRKAQYHQPFHAALASQIARLRDRHAAVVLYDCHAIRSRIPRLFDGQLPALNVGTNDGASCSPELQAIVAEACSASGRDYVVNGRFKGGAITRQYGQPDAGVHAIQMELACRAYMHEPADAPSEDNWPSPWSADASAALRATLQTLLQALRDWAARQKPNR